MAKIDQSRKNSPAKTTEHIKQTSIFKKAVIISLAVFFTSILFALLIAELLIRYVSPQMTLNQAKQVSLRAFSKSKILPYELIPNLTSRHIGHTFEFDYQFSTNTLGLRGEEIDRENADKHFRILMLGDSMIFGWGVEDNETIPSYLEEMLNEELTNLVEGKVEVINAGMASGFSPDTYYLYLKKKGLDLKPDLVVVNLFLRNDIYDLFETEWIEKDDFGYPTKISSKYRILEDGYFSYLDRDWKLQVPILNNSHLGILTLTVFETKMPKIADLIKSRIKKPSTEQIKNTESEIELCLYGSKCQPEFEDKLQELRMIMQGIKQLTTEHNIDLLVILIPDPYQLERVKNNIKEKDPYAFIKEDYDAIQSAPDIINSSRPQNLFRNILDEENINYLDILGSLVIKESDTLFFKGDGHYRKEGNKKIAKSISDYFSSEKEIIK